MHYNKKLLTYVLTILTFLTLVIIPVAARAEDDSDNERSEGNKQEKRFVEGRDGESSGDRREKFQEFKEKLKIKLEDRKKRLLDTLGENRCELRKNRVDNKINAFEVSKRFHQNQFNNSYERLTNLVERLKDKDVDTAKLEADLAILKTKLDALNTKYDTLKTKLKDLGTLDCTDKEKFNNSLNELQPLVTDIRNTVLDIRSYFINTIRPDLRAIRAQLKDDDSKESSESED